MGVLYVSRICSNHDSADLREARNPSGELQRLDASHKFHAVTGRALLYPGRRLLKHDSFFPNLVDVHENHAVPALSSVGEKGAIGIDDERVFYELRHSMST